MKLYDTGVYLLNGQKIVPENQADVPVSKENAAKNTIAYSILEAHNTSGNMEKLQIKFDKLTSHDITFVGIIQTARASGLEKFPVPYVLTNCHNSLCAVGGTINEDDHMFGLTCAKKYGGVYVPPPTVIPVTVLWELWQWEKADRSLLSSFFPRLMISICRE